MALVGHGSGQGTATCLKRRFKTDKYILQNDPRRIKTKPLKAIRGRFMCEMDWFTDHASMVNIDGVDQLFEPLLGDPLFNHTILNGRKVTLPIEFKFQRFGDDGIYEPTSQNMEAVLGSSDTTSNSIILPGTITEYNTKIGRFGDQRQLPRVIRQAQFWPISGSSGPLAQEGGGNSANDPSQGHTLLYIDAQTIRLHQHQYK